jgi:uncharacterized protein YbgA (DUF1722 family)
VTLLCASEGTSSSGAAIIRTIFRTAIDDNDLTTLPRVCGSLRAGRMPLEARVSFVVTYIVKFYKKHGAAR